MMSSVIPFRKEFEQAFEKSYLRALQKDDYEVVKVMIERDLKVISVLPVTQQLRLAEMLHSAVGEIIARNISAKD
jgi:hypothetical protein